MPNSRQNEKSKNPVSKTAAPRTETQDLARRIRSAKTDDGIEVETRARSDAEISSRTKALRLGAEFFSAVIVGFFIGYFADKTFGSAPWGLLVMVLMGFAAGVLNVVRSVEQINAGVEITPEMDLGSDENLDENEDGYEQ